IVMTIQVVDAQADQREILIRFREFPSMNDLVTKRVSAEGQSVEVSPNLDPHNDRKTSSQVRVSQGHQGNPRANPVDELRLQSYAPNRVAHLLDSEAVRRDGT